MNYKEELKKQVSFLLKEIPYENIIVENPKNRNMGDLALPCFSYAKILHKNPNVIAEEIKEKLPNSYEKIEVVNGYVNVFLNKKEFTEEILTEIKEQQENYGNNIVGTGKNIVVEYSSPNIAKPFGVGHLRSTVIGEALKNICKKNGYTVYSINYLGDYGTQFGKLIYAYKEWGNSEEFQKSPIDELKRVYVKFHQEAENNPSLEEEGRRWFKRLEENDEEATNLWKIFRDESLKEFDKTYQLLGIDSFDSYDGESYYKDKMDLVLEELEQKNLLEISDGATIVRLGENVLPALVKRSDGASLYITRDLAAILDRKKRFHFDEALYVVGNEQTLHFEQMKLVLDKMGYDFSKNIHHISFGMVLQNGKKMSTRHGRSVKLQDVLEEAIALAKQYIEDKNPSLENKEEVSKKIGVGAVIFNDLKNYRTNDIEFSLEDMLKFEGETGPYVAYTYARISSLLRMHTLTDFSYNTIDVNEFVWNIVFKLYEFKEVIIRAKENYDPSELAKYLLDLCSCFNRFYANEKIVDNDIEKTNFRLTVSYCVATVLKEGMRLLGIALPDRM